MKSLKLFLLLLSAIFAGCADIEEGHCPSKENLTVRFSLKDKDGKDALAVNIDNVDLFIYNQSGILAAHSSISKSELNQFGGKRLEIAPGKYSIVAWANIANHQDQLFHDPFKDYTSSESNYVVQPFAAVDGTYTNGSPLYYSLKGAETLSVIVPDEGAAEVEAPFGHAHVKLEVSVKGYNSNNSRTAADPLTIEITDIIPNYCFQLVSIGTPVSYIQKANVAVPNIRDYVAMFNVPLLDRTTSTQIKISNSAGDQIVTPIKLADLIPTNINIDEVLHIPIVITFGSDGMVVDVTVNLPGWEDNSTTGEV